MKKFTIATFYWCKEYSNSCFFQSVSIINSFRATSLFLYALKTLENQKFSGGIERDQWHDMI